MQLYSAEAAHFFTELEHRYSMAFEAALPETLIEHVLPSSFRFC